MSIEVMTWAWKTQLKPNLKLTLLALADYSNDEGFCWPSIDSMVKKSNITRSSVISNVQKLCDIGVIEKQKRYENGKRSSNEYRIKIELSPESIRMDFGCLENVRTESIRMKNESVSPENRPMTNEPSVNRQLYNCANARKRANSAANYSCAFLAFYAEYPRKRDKKRAWQIWIKINHEEKLTEKIMNGLKKYKTEIRLKKIENEFIKYPAAWLKGECWEDEYETAITKITHTTCKDCGKKIPINLGCGGYCEDCCTKHYPAQVNYA